MIPNWAAIICLWEPPFRSTEAEKSARARRTSVPFDAVPVTEAGQVQEMEREAEAER